MFWSVLILTLIITLRESLEAILIIAILLAYLRTLDVRYYSKWIWYGVLLGISISFGLGIFMLLLSVNLTGLLEKAYEGTISIIASIILTYMILWISKNAHKMSGEIGNKISAYISEQSLMGLLLLSFFAVFREGLETVLFLSVFFNLDLLGVMIGLGIALSLGLIIGYLILFLGVRIPARRFFMISSIFLLIIASGIFCYGVHEFIELFESIGYSMGILREAIWSTHLLLPEESLLGQILKVLVGYDENPELLRVIAYVSYWFIIVSYLFCSKR